MTNRMRKKGDILKAKNRGYNAGKHYIVFYEEYDGRNIIGAMITHSQNDKNVSMSESHFEKVDENDIQYKFQF